MVQDLGFESCWVVRGAATSAHLGRITGFIGLRQSGLRVSGSRASRLKGLRPAVICEKTISCYVAAVNCIVLVGRQSRLRK